MADEKQRTQPTSENQAQRRAALAISSPGQEEGDHGMSPEQSTVCRTAALKFKTSWFTIGMFCEHAKVLGTDCLPVFDELVSIGCIRKPHNDGGAEFYQVVPELAMRAVMMTMPRI